MTTKKAKYKREILTTREEALKAAHRYFDNAKKTISKVPVEYGRYTDSKYVSEAAGTAYLAALRAIDSYLLGKGIHHDQLPKSIKGYWTALDKYIPLNGKLAASLDTVYENLHVFAYYRNGIGVGLIKEGFNCVKKIIDMMAK